MDAYVFLPRIESDFCFVLFLLDTATHVGRY